MDLLQFADRPNGSTDDAVSQVIHNSFSLLDSRKGGYVRMLFNDSSSAFNTIVPTRLAGKQIELGLNNPFCAWILDFLTARPQIIRVGGQPSRPLTLNTGSHQGCVLSPLLYSRYTHDCLARFSSNTIVKFADDTVVVGLISGYDEKVYLEKVANLSLNVSTIKELIVDFRRTLQHQGTYTPLEINGTAAERLSRYRYLGVHITWDLTWTTHIDTLVRKVKQRLNHLRQLRRFRVSRKILQTFYAGAVESIHDREHQCLVRQQLLSGQEGSAEGGTDWYVWLNALLALHSPPCRTCTPGGVEPEPAGS